MLIRSLTVIAILICLLLLFGCTTRPQIDRVEIRTKFVATPEALMYCPKPPVLTEEQIKAIDTEQEYNEALVLPLYLNNETCYNSMNNIKAYNKGVEDLNN